MIQNADVIERLGTLIGREITDENLHEALFCEKKHQKVLVRFQLGKHSYVHFKTPLEKSNATYADIKISGNPNTFRVRIEQENDQWIVHSEARVSYEYI